MIFRNWVLQNFPFLEDDFDALTDYELFCKMVEYMKKSLDKIKDYQTELNEFRTELDSYKNYFDNLDVQEEINNKLDEMAESGQLTDIIAQYLQLAGVIAFNTKADMKSSENLANGSICKTLGVDNYKDGLGSFYKIREITNQDIVDDDNIVALTNYNNLVAEKILNANIRMFNITTDNTFNEIQKMMNYPYPKVLNFETGEYTFAETFRLNKNTTLLLNNSTLTFNVPSVLDSWWLSHGFFNFKDDDEFLEYNGNGNINILNGTIVGGNCSFIHGSNINIKNIHFLNCKNDHILELCGMNGVNIENCIFEGVPVGVDNFKENIQLDNCTRLNFPFFTDEENVTYDGTTTKNVTIKNNIFKNSDNENYAFYTAIGMHGFEQDKYHTNIIIENNKFIDVVNTVMQLINSKNVTIINNEFTKDGYTEDLTGSMIRFRNENENIKIIGNIFDGNVRAIEEANIPLLNKNISIIDNIFKNYKYSDASVAALNLYDPLNTVVNNNIFTDFTQKLIKVNCYDNTDTSVNNIYIENNTFKSKVNIGANIIDLSCGNCYINNNTFDADGLSYSYSCVIANNVGTQQKLYAKGNIFGTSLINETIKSIEDNKSSNNYHDVYGVLVKGYGGTASTTSLTNQALNVAFSHFNKMILTLGDGAHTQIVTLSSFTPQNKLDARTYTIPTVNISNGNLEVTSLTLNSNGTINYSSTGTPLRNLNLYNE